MKTITLSGAVLLATLSTLSLAQHDMHNMAGAETGVVSTEPANNAVLASSPETIMLHFDSTLTLVKLAVKDPKSDIVNIGFRFDPTPNFHFSHLLPKLEPVDYYTVEWAALSSEGKLLRGNFYFSFGEDAKPPSYYLERLEHPIHIMAPDFRLL